MPAPETVSGFPFLISRGRDIGVRVVVTPGFMILPPWLDRIRSLGRDRPTGNNVASYSHVDTPYGPRFVVFRVYTARGQDFGLDPGPLRDRSGRPILVTEGILLDDETAPDPSVSDELLRRAHECVIEPFRAVWSSPAHAAPDAVGSTRVAAPPDISPTSITLEPDVPGPMAGPSVMRDHDCHDVVPTRPSATFDARMSALALTGVLLSGGIGFLLGTTPPQTTVASAGTWREDRIIGQLESIELQQLSSACDTLRAVPFSASSANQAATAPVSGVDLQKFRDSIGNSTKVECAFWISLGDLATGHLRLTSDRTTKSAVARFDKAGNIVELTGY